VRIVLHILRIILLCAFYFSWCRRSARDRAITVWSQGLLKILNLQVQIVGHPPKQQGCLIVGNHISWLDIHIIHAILPARFVAKSEIRSWPVFGWIAQQSGTLFIRRHSHQDAAKIVGVVSDCMHQGDLICCFPEGTTSSGHHVLAFKGSLLQAAIDAEVNVQPLMLRYVDEQGEVDVRMAFIGDDTIVQSLAKILCIRQPKVVIKFLVQISSQGHDRKSLSNATHDAISQAMQTK
jgi:1-acyl-sn-glycerol-3-phosphate acyltransferase